MDEPDIKPLLNELMAAGWTVVMPAVERNHLVFRIVTDLSQNVRNPVSNILEASADCEPADESTILDVIVPGRAFTGAGLRMGRGNGGYDRWLEAFVDKVGLERCTAQTPAKDAVHRGVF